MTKLSGNTYKFKPYRDDDLEVTIPVEALWSFDSTLMMFVAASLREMAVHATGWNPSKWETFEDWKAQLVTWADRLEAGVGDPFDFERWGPDYEDRGASTLREIIEHVRELWD